VETDDRLAIHELMALYGHVVDEREWSRVPELFTDDAVYDLSPLGLGVFVGPDAIRSMWTAETTHHPLAHHVTNVIITVDEDGTVRSRSKIIAPGKSGRVASYSYRDIVRWCDDGQWRMSERIISRRTPTD
jgi:ketosteroid isomerase-like protein